MRHELTTWDTLTEDRKLFLKNCAGFGIGEPSPIYNSYDAEGAPVGAPVGWEINHPRFRLEHVLEIEEALQIPEEELPKITEDSQPTQREIKDKLNERIRPLDENGESLGDDIAEKIEEIKAKAAVSEDGTVDLKAEIASFRTRSRKTRQERIDNVNAKRGPGPEPV